MTNPSHPSRSRGPQRTLEEAAALVCQWQASGLGKQVWCNEQGILRSALNSYLHRTKRQVIAAPPVSHPFIELQRRPPVTASPRLVRLTLAGSVATAELTVDDLGMLIQRLSEARS
jgi:hypothetical protein